MVSEFALEVLGFEALPVLEEGLVESAVLQVPES